MKTDNIERIERYLRGQMTEDEAAAFEQDVRQDAELRDEARATARMIKEMRRQRAEQAQEIVEDVQAAVNAPAAASEIPFDVDVPAAAARRSAAKVASANPFARFMKYAASIAVLLCLSLGGLHFYGTNKTSKLFAQNYQTLELTASRGNGQAAMELKELFDKIGTTDGKELGLTIYQLQQAYKQTRTSYDYGEYIYDIQWYMALGYLKKNELGKARQLLSQIIQENYSDNPYLPRAIALYEEIHNLYFL